MSKTKRPVIYWRGKWTLAEKRTLLSMLEDITGKGWDSRKDQGVCILASKGTESYSVNEIKFVGKRPPYSLTLEELATGIRNLVRDSR